jgi:hypothetical protein
MESSLKGCDFNRDAKMDSMNATLQAAENPVLLKGTASAVPQVLCCKGALAPEVRFLFQKAAFPRPV